MGLGRTEGKEPATWSRLWASPGQDIVFLKNIFYLFLFSERGREGEREGEKHQYVVASPAPPTGGLARNQDVCSDWGLNWLPLGLQAGTQSTKPHQGGRTLP